MSSCRFMFRCRACSAGSVGGVGLEVWAAGGEALMACFGLGREWKDRIGAGYVCGGAWVVVLWEGRDRGRAMISFLMICGGFGKQFGR